jgi:hypothetical protein
MDDKIKFSMGKLYTGLLIYQILGEMPLWETEGYGSKFSFTDEDNFSARIEFKPIPGLNVGAQFFFIDNPRPGKSIGETGAFGELGLAASYNSSLFNAQLGVRFDSAVDTMTPGSTYSGESKTYLPAYYGSGNYLGTPLASAMMGGPKYKHAGEVIDQQTVGQLPDGTYGLVSTPATDPYYDGGHMAFFGFKLNAVPNVVAVAHGGFYNLGAFDKFGYGRFAEEIRYDGIFSRLGVGIILQQEFYGSDVFHDTMENSPFLQFMPELIYDLIKLPGMRIPLLTAKLFANFGICPDVLESYITIEPLLDMRMGTFDVKLSYAYSYAEYVDAANIEPATTHKIKCSLELMF